MASATTPTADRPSASSPTPTADAPAGGYPLDGPSTHPDPRTHAYRQDLADIALAGTVIASHYAVPLERRLTAACALRAAPGDTADILAELEPGAIVRILDKRGGWAWGYAGDLVGYVPAASLSA
ncbi:SH3 domain-containing protein [Sphingomonas humi]|uniref:Bacterial dipeptidyl-peptidase SH3 domain-containing protein n=1 Tax=Sphingomonas humi TaxID=335630 RepID=A0ABP7S260_9SPHN